MVAAYCGFVLLFILFCHCCCQVGLMYLVLRPGKAKTSLHGQFNCLVFLHYGD